MDTDFVFHPIGIVHSCFTEKFGIPRQPGLVPTARASLEILPPFDRDEAFRGLDDFSHLWIVFVFHGIDAGKWQPTVRPPRLGGNRRVGVFATRSGFRPNSIGISSVVLEGVRRDHGKIVLELSGIDMLDQTPVLDIKPYLPYADSIPDANGSYAADSPRSSLSIDFTSQALQACAMLELTYPGFCDLVKQVLRADPRPAYVGKSSGRTEFGMKLYGINVRWTTRQGSILVHTVDAHPVEPERQ